MAKYLHKFETNSEFSAVYNGEDYLEPWVSVTNENEKVKYNKTEYEKQLSTPLTFEIQSDGVINWKTKDGDAVYITTIEYSLNGGEWTSIRSTTAGTQFSVSSGDTVQFRGDNARYSSGSARSNTFSGTTCQFKAYGNIMSLIDSDGYADMTTLPAAYNFPNLMSYCTGLTDAENLILPATALTFSCYNGMFYGCTSLTSAPELPATTLAESCYYGMFQHCTSLTTAPELPATTLASHCYLNMFNGCTALTTAPDLPATALTNSYCYMGMFEGCTNLTAAPELPATTLASGCYNRMFYGCTSLTSAPELPATALTQSCYVCMFQGCTSLTSAPELPATTLAERCYAGMFINCTGLTTAPALPATTLAEGCYMSLFSGCTSLITASELPATTLAVSGYNQMFYGCTSLTSAPELPATTLVPHCYNSMFQRCTSLNYVKCLATDISATGCTSNWLSNVSSTGTFVKHPDKTWTTGTSGIPANWTVQDAS